MRRLARLLAMTTVPLVISLASLTGMTAPAHASTGGDETQFLADTNAVRSAHGLAPLSIDGSLTAVAHNWSAHMAAAGDISHNPSLASQVTADWTKLGENVGMGPTVESIQTAFVNSPHHYANIVDPSFRYVGIGVVYGPGGTIFVTLDFMQLAGHSSGTASAPRTTPTTSAPRTTVPHVVSTPTPAPAPAPVPAAAPAPPPPPPPPPPTPVQLPGMLEQLRALDAA